MMRLIKAVKGLMLALLNMRVVDLRSFQSKRIAIVGPASSAFNTGKGSYIDGFDLVVRINKSAMTVDSAKHENDIGRRTDVLFHCFVENLQSGGGPLDFDLYDRLGIRYVINPRNEWTGLRNSFNFYKKYLRQAKTYLLPRSLYVRIRQPLGGYRPTTGYSALCALMESEFTELYITGFTFFKTAYGVGYRDEMKESKQALSFIKGAGWHNPEYEFQEFKRLLQKNAHKKVITDQELTNILATN